MIFKKNFDAFDYQVIDTIFLLNEIADFLVV